MLARHFDGGSHVIRLAVGDDADFIQRKSLDGVQDKGLAIGAAGAFQSELHQRDHLVGGSDVFGRRGAPVGDHVFSGKSFVGLMKLELRLIAGADVRTPGGILQMNREQALRAAGREVLDGAKGKVVKPRLKGQSFWLFSSIRSVAQSARNGFVDDVKKFPARELRRYIAQSHALVAKKLTRKAQRELGLV